MEDNLEVNFDVCINDEAIEEMLKAGHVEVTKEKIIKFREFLKDNLADAVDSFIDDTILYYAEECEDQWNE